MVVDVFVEELGVRQPGADEGRSEEHRVEGDRGGLDLAVVRLDIERRAVGRLEHEARVDIETVVVVDRLVVQETVVVEAVGLAVVRGDLPTRGLGHRAGEHHRTGGHVVLTDPDLGAAGKHIRGLGGRDDDGTSRSVTAIDGALRTLHDLDLLQVGVLAVESGRVGLQHTVDDEREAVLGVAGTVDAADVDLSIGDLGGLHERHARRQADEVPCALHGGRFERVGSECGDRGRHILQTLGALSSGGDHHFFEDLGARLLGER